jgi:hypothetical protein
MCNLILVDSHNREIGSASADEVQQDLLYHREVMVIARDEAGRFLLRRATRMPLSDRWGVTGREAQQAGDEPVDTAHRMLVEMGLVPLDPIEKIGELPASWELGFAFLTIFSAEVAIEGEAKSLCRMTVDRCSRLIQFAVDSFTFHLCQALRLCPEFREPPAASELSEAIERFFSFPEGRALLPRYEVVAAADGAVTDLLGEIRSHSSQFPWLRDLLGVFENSRPYYPAPYGLEVGELLLGATPIAEGIDEIARVIADYQVPLRVVGKLESGRLVADRLEQALRKLGGDVERFDVSTTWLGHGEAQHFGSLPTGILSPRRNVICDTMISSGATFNAIHTSIAAQGGGDEAEAVVLAAVDRSRYYLPSKIHSVRSVKGHDWIVGFNSDAPSNGESIGRSLPFLATLKPRGTGTRFSLIDNLI